MEVTKLFQDDNIFTPAAGDYDSYDIRQNSSGLFPPEYYAYYLHKEDIMKKISAQVRYEECPDAPYEKFAKTGDAGNADTVSVFML
ncbi:hypothetical protein BDR06DRAFT_413314 [Suillus hirtellus]|nr:hypothetical protein BDR06DRAFT_413314 [Suillus hirtellus]